MVRHDDGCTAAAGGEASVRQPHNPDADVIEELNCVSVKVELFRASTEGEPVKSWATPSGWKEGSEAHLDRTVDSGSFLDGPSSTEWLIKVTNSSHRRVRCQAGLRGIYARWVMQSAQVAQRVINHGFKVVLEALTPRGVVSGSLIELGFGEELVGYTHAGALRMFDAILRSARP